MKMFINILYLINYSNNNITSHTAREKKGYKQICSRKNMWKTTWDDNIMVCVYVHTREENDISNTDDDSN